MKIGPRSWSLPYVLVWKLERIGWYSTVSLIIQSSCVINSLPSKKLLVHYGLLWCRNFIYHVGKQVCIDFPIS